MTLKELRISKGLNQSECALYLGMSVRNYQNYENYPEKAKNARYYAIVRELNSYGESEVKNEVKELDAVYSNFYTNVIRGENLRFLTEGVAKFGKRNCFDLLQKYIQNNCNGKISILYGLRRTGKTTLLFQMIRELPYSQTAYVKIKTTDNMSHLTKDLEHLNREGCKYVFIDEITLMDDFIGTAAVLSDIFATMGMKIVVSGTDSLGFAMANRDELYDRNVMIHTSFIPFREYSKLLGISSVDRYIEYGGTLKIENMDFDDPDFSLDEVSFRDEESTRKYIDSSISRNIQHTLKNDRFGEFFNELRELYECGELTNVINRIVESMNHSFLLSVVRDKFKSHDLGSAKQLLLHDYPDEAAHVLYDVNENEIVERLKKLIDVKETYESSVKITQNHLNKIKKYLFMLDLIADCKEVYESHGEAEHTVFTQPGMRFSIAKALVCSLMKDEYFSTRSEAAKQHVTDKILEDVKGRMLEDIVLFETKKSATRNKDVFKFKFDDGGEFDMVIYDREKNSCRLYEVKHSETISPPQTRYLRDEEKLSVISRRFGKVDKKYVIYRGQSQTCDGIEYVNVEEYLKALGYINDIT